MQTITYIFTPLRDPLNGRSIHARGLHGFLFNIARQADKEEANWLHKHPAPRPFSMVPLYSEEGFLAGVRLSAITERAATLLMRTGEWFCEQQRPCHIGGQEFVISEVRQTPGPSWQQLAYSQPVRQVGLHFVSPTAFKQGPGLLPLPLSANVFGTAVRVWEAFAPPMMYLPENWLEWCRQDVFVTRHQIQTVTLNIDKREQFTGFVGEVWYQAHKGAEANLCAWQAITDLTTFCGTGYKTTMGMGAVERI